MDGLLSTQDVANKLNVSPNTVKKLWREGRLRGSRISERKLRFRPADVEDFLQRSGAPAEPKTPSGFRVAEDRWAEEHPERMREMAGQWVVLEPYGIAAHDSDPLVAFAKAKEKGIAVPYIFYIDHPNSPGSERLGL